MHVDGADFALDTRFAYLAHHHGQLDSLVAQAADCPPGSLCELVAGDRIIALFNVDGTLYALDGVCPHQGGPLGKRDVLDDGIVTCPWHGWQFDVRNGQHQLSKSLRQPRFDVRLDGDSVLVDLDSSL